jgi:maleylacetoacetate isomerase/maleylpyruvate isomerase
MHRKPDGSVTGLPRLCRTGAAIGQPAVTYACGYPGLLDACLVPQVFAARRFGLDLTPYPHIVRVDAAWPPAGLCAAHPARQADARILMLTSRAACMNQASFQSF